MLQKETPGQAPLPDSYSQTMSDNLDLQVEGEKGRVRSTSPSLNRLLCSGAASADNTTVLPSATSITTTRLHIPFLHIFLRILHD